MQLSILFIRSYEKPKRTLWPTNKFLENKIRQITDLTYSKFKTLKFCHLLIEGNAKYQKWRRLLKYLNFSLKIVQLLVKSIFSHFQR